MVTATKAWLSQATTIRLGNELELIAEQTSTISLWRFLCPLTVPISSASTVTDENGRIFEVVGEVASRPALRPRWWAASLHLISDMQ